MTDYLSIIERAQRIPTPTLYDFKGYQITEQPWLNYGRCEVDGYTFYTTDEGWQCILDNLNAFCTWASL